VRLSAAVFRGVPHPEQAGGLGGIGLKELSLISSGTRRLQQLLPHLQNARSAPDFPEGVELRASLP